MNYVPAPIRSWYNGIEKVVAVGSNETKQRKVAFDQQYSPTN